MSKEVSVIILGLLVAVAPYLGLPGSWRSVLLVIIGLGLAALGFFLRREALSRGAATRGDFFVDSRPQATESPFSHEAHASRPRVG